MSAPVYALLKRPDELFVVEHAHLQPRFVEDSVRYALAGPRGATRRSATTTSCSRARSTSRRSTTTTSSRSATARSASSARELDAGEPARRDTRRSTTGSAPEHRRGAAPARSPLVREQPRMFSRCRKTIPPAAASVRCAPARTPRARTRRRAARARPPSTRPTRSAERRRRATQTRRAERDERRERRGTRRRWSRPPSRPSN